MSAKVVRVWRAENGGWWYLAGCPHAKKCWTANEIHVGDLVFCSECGK